VYLSRLVINSRNLLGFRSLLDPYEAHRTIWRGFPEKDRGGPGRVLFRLERSAASSRLVMLVQSSLEPNWRPLLEEQILLSADDPKELKPDLLDRLSRAGRRLRFRLRANPTARRIADETSREEGGNPVRKRVGLFGDDQQMKWLQRKAEQGGFRLIDCRISARGNSDCRKTSQGKRQGIRHLSVLFEGILEVTDGATFLATLQSGIGSAKGFGFGLLSVAPVS